MIPARATDSDAKLWAVNALAVPDCFDEVRAEEFSRYTAEDGRPERIDKYHMVVGLRIDPARAGGHAILRSRGWDVVVIVNEPPPRTSGRRTSAAS